VQWICFPEQVLDWRKDIKALSARRWATRLTPEQFKRSTGTDRFPDYFKNDIHPDGSLDVFANGEITYTLRGVHAKVSALWKFEAPPGAGDTHYALLRGTRANLIIKQGPEQNYKPVLYAENLSTLPPAQFERTVRAALDKFKALPGLSCKAAGNMVEVVIPDQYRVSHEEHFAQVTERFLRYLEAGNMPDWEVPAMLTKYYTTTEAYRLSHAKP